MPEARRLARRTTRATLTLAGLLGWVLAASPRAAEDPELNVVLFLVDDLGWRDTSVALDPEIEVPEGPFHTPNVERLAREGVRFSNAYAASPVCTPTRTSIMTGLAPDRTRITNWTIRGNVSKKHPRLESPDWNYNGLTSADGLANAHRSPFLAALLSARGYRTIHVGKAHFGSLDSDAQDPTRIGFRVNVAGHASGGPASYYGEDHYKKSKDESTRWDVPGLEEYHGTSTFLTDALTERAVREVEASVRAGERFFLHFAPYAVHAPIMAHPELVGHYRDDYDPREAAYASMVEAVDRSLGVLWRTLERLRVADRTVIVFFSDNGGLSAHARGGPPHEHNRPLRSGKGSAYEGGIRVPLIVRWPGVTPAGELCREPVIAMDLYPTLLEAASVPVPEEVTRAGDGLSLVPLLEAPGGEPPAAFGSRAFVWHYPHQWGAPGPGIHPFSAIRDGRMKLIWFHDEGALELYDLESDIGESENIAAEHPSLTRALSDALSKRLRSVDALLPIRKETGEPVALPSSHELEPAAHGDAER